MTPALINWTYNCIDQAASAVVPPLNLREEVRRVEALPPLPGMAARIMKLASDPLADAGKLASVVETDPLLTAQVLRWAGSALYGFDGHVNSVKDAIVKVLGYNFVFNLVLGLAALQPLKAPLEGKLGLRSFWTHALASTHLMKLMNDRLGSDKQDESLVFMAALLHNIGFPLMGHLFIEQFRVLNNLCQVNSGLSLVKLEKFALGIGHDELGCLLLRTWGLPEALTEVVYHHHNPHYQGRYYYLNLLTYVNDQLLARIDIGDGHKHADLGESAQAMLLAPDDCDAMLQKIQQRSDDLAATVAACLSGI